MPRWSFVATLHSCPRYCDELVCLSVRSHTRSRTSPNLCACCLSPRFGPPLTALRYVIYFRFCGCRPNCYGIVAPRVWLSGDRRQHSRDSSWILLIDEDGKYSSGGGEVCSLRISCCVWSQWTAYRYERALKAALFMLVSFNSVFDVIRSFRTVCN